MIRFMGGLHLTLQMLVSTDRESVHRRRLRFGKKEAEARHKIQNESAWLKRGRPVHPRYEVICPSGFRRENLSSPF
jgi:hypothetical protein